MSVEGNATNDVLKGKVIVIPQTDETLSKAGYSADAKVTGNKFAEVELSISKKQNSLGFTPVQQGGGVGQSGNKIKIGWDNSSKLLYDIDNGAGEGTFASESWVTSQIQASIKATWEASY